MKFTGTYVQGKGEGASFVCLEGYRSRMKKQFKFTPFPGTFNVDVEREAVECLKRSSFITITGFEENGKEFFSCKMRPAVVGRLPAFLVIPEKTIHPKNVLEFVSLFELKKELKLKPGDEVEIEL